jgi:hypothetical protein
MDAEVMRRKKLCLVTCEILRASEQERGFDVKRGALLHVVIYVNASAC